MQHLDYFSNQAEGQRPIDVARMVGLSACFPAPFIAIIYQIDALRIISHSSVTVFGGHLSESSFRLDLILYHASLAFLPALFFRDAAATRFSERSLVRWWLGSCLLLYIASIACYNVGPANFKLVFFVKSFFLPSLAILVCTCNKDSYAIWQRLMLISWVLLLFFCQISIIFIFHEHNALNLNNSVLVMYQAPLPLVLYAVFFASCTGAALSVFVPWLPAARGREGVAGR